MGDISSLRENWNDAALFVAPDDRAELAATLRELIDDPARREALGAAAYARAQEFTVQRMAEKYLRVYEEAAAHALTETGGR